MSTIERAAERLAKLNRPARDGHGDSDGMGSAAESQPAGSPTPVESSVGGAERAAGDAERSSETRSLTFVGGGYHEIDLEALAANEFVTSDNWRTRLGLDFRRIKRPLLINARRGEQGDRPNNVIAVTSAVPGEGKTFVSINLALSIAAEVDLNVLLVDGDAARDSISTVLGLKYDRGLSDVLARGGRHLEDCIFQTNVDHLMILPSGSNLPNTDELLASDLMRRVVGDLAAADPNRIIVLDTPPLLAGTEAAVLTQLVGQIVVVVEANSTPQSTVEEALAAIRGRGNVSLVLNKVPRRGGERHGDGYGYGYGYGYGRDA